MRHQVNKRNFGRQPSQRLALMRGLADQLIQHERIETTLIKAKELRKVVEPLVTLAKREDLHARRQAAAQLYTKESVKMLFDTYGPRFKDRPGGYTRIIRSGFRRGDAAATAIIEFVKEGDSKVKKSTKKAKKGSPKKSVSSQKEGAAISAKGSKKTENKAELTASKKKEATPKETEA